MGLLLISVVYLVGLYNEKLMGCCRLCLVVCKVLDSLRSWVLLMMIRLMLFWLLLVFLVIELNMKVVEICLVKGNKVFFNGFVIVNVFCVILMSFG